MTIDRPHSSKLTSAPLAKASKPVTTVKATLERFMRCYRRLISLYFNRLEQ
ncbi:hypothetical protein CA13_53510 [Planctomycetes bacterium CA13]|uniref:Uncharacterized protein n=1 Tax=Novipirellula herctigrandis TaxID=2527986 RepID=A0A5C5Z9K1_9BACT|nr:hypothetical protein CA13_53510 [Planctomycetes bacterium CA13]